MLSCSGSGIVLSVESHVKGVNGVAVQGMKSSWLCQHSKRPSKVNEVKSQRASWSGENSKMNHTQARYFVAMLHQVLSSLPHQTITNSWTTRRHSLYAPCSTSLNAAGRGGSSFAKKKYSHKIRLVFCLIQQLFGCLIGPAIIGRCR